MSSNSRKHDLLRLDLVQDEFVTVQPLILHLHHHIGYHMFHLDYISDNTKV